MRIDSSINLFVDFMGDEDSSKEQTLFLSVILQALLDATKPAHDKEPMESVQHRDRATAWFFASVGVTAEDFSTVCELAGVEPNYCREFAFKVLKSGEVKYVRKRINALLTHTD
tara:strand:+ start:13856 stop:14197 length:342 start_codon:yes stop_codon:yes gene_type:complete